MWEEVVSNFNNPRKKYFSKIRYWLPEAAVDPVKIKEDFHDFNKRGFKGVEVVPYLKNQKEYQVPASLAWGTERWKETVQTILEYARSFQLTVDFAIGPKWPIAMPLRKGADDLAALYELSYGYEVISSDEKFFSIPKNKNIRKSGVSNLLAISAYKIVSHKTIDEHTYIDLTSNVDLGSKIDCSFVSSGETWVIFSFWVQPSDQTVGGKWYVVDHFSKKGAEACADYWLNNLKDVICSYPDVVEDIFCDSLEYEVSCEWTRGFNKIFIKEKGYDIIPFLPVIGESQTYPNNNLCGFKFLNSQLSTQVNNDYKSLLSKLFVKNHLEPLKKMANKLGMNLRYQVAYNKPLAIETSAKAVSIPEGESLGRVAINNLRSMSGAVHLSGKNIYSFEGSAEFLNAYGQTFEDIFWWLKRSYLGGTNTQVFHGAAYSGADPTSEITSWPGYENFGKRVSNYWNRTLSVTHMKNYLKILARFNYILQKKHLVDLAIYRQDFLNNGKGGDGEYLLRDNNLLINHGYSYDFVSPDLLAETNPKIKQGRLAVDGPSYKAMIFPYITEISQEGVRQIKRCIAKDFPVFFVGTLPECSFFKSERVLEKVDWENLLQNNKVFYVKDYDALLKTFDEEKIYPDVYSHGKTSLGTIHTQDQFGDYYYLYNFNSVEFSMYPEINTSKKIFNPKTVYPTLDRENKFFEKKVEISIPGSQDPMLMNIETGQLEKLYSQKETDHSWISLTFGRDEAKIIFMPHTKVRNEQVFKEHKTFELVEDERSLEHWSLDLYDFEIEDGEVSFFNTKWKKKANYQLVTPLLSWNHLSDVQKRFAGKGVYRTHFDLSDSKSSTIFMSIDQISDSYEIRINGQKLTPISFFRFKVNITPYLVKGNNLIEIEVYSNLYNYLNEGPIKDYGLIGEVKIGICHIERGSY